VQHPVVIGLQYGDEGKGKITDRLAGEADWVIRFNGGNNAGHTLWLNGKKVVTHSIPSGVRSPNAKNFIGPGCVVNPKALLEEMEEIQQTGAKLSPQNLQIDGRVHLILPVQLALDAAREGSEKGIGSTKRGIGPTYASKMDRSGIRLMDCGAPDLKEKLQHLLSLGNAQLNNVGARASNFEENLQACVLAKEKLWPFMSTEANPFWEASRSQKCVLEGAQGVLLDIDHGFFPFVTSSTTLPSAAGAGAPFPISRIGAVLGVAKAYLTRVGRGPLVTEMSSEAAERLRQKGQEFGATTGRPRRMGWLHVDELRDAVRLSDTSHVVLTKADILSGESQVGLWINGALEMVQGWPSVMDGNKLHSNFEQFVKRVESHVGVPVLAVGTGPDRADLHFRYESKDFWNLRK
jgi:adenylosuccinate synthase